MSRTFLLVGSELPAQWAEVLRRSVAAWGRLDVFSEKDALQRLGCQEYDVVILDAGQVTNMPDFISQARKALPKTRLIVATASPTVDDARQAFRSSADDYIRKTLDEQELRSNIQAVLEISPPTRPRRKVEDG